MELYAVAIGSFRERLLALHEDLTLLESVTAKRPRAGSDARDGAGDRDPDPDLEAGGGGGEQESESESARAATEMRSELDERWRDLQSLLSETLAKLAGAIDAKLGATHVKLLVCTSALECQHLASCCLCIQASVKWSSDSAHCVDTR